MTTINVETLVNQRGESKTKVFINSGAGKDFFSNLNKGQVPSVEKIISLADYLEVSVDYLLGRTNELQSNHNTINNKGKVEINGTQANVINNQQNLDEMEIELVKRFKTLSFDKKLDVFNYIKSQND